MKSRKSTAKQQRQLRKRGVLVAKPEPVSVPNAARVRGILTALGYTNALFQGYSFDRPHNHLLFTSHGNKLEAVYVEMNQNNHTHYPIFTVMPQREQPKEPVMPTRGYAYDDDQPPIE